jgi:hypothetical protein
MDQVMKDKSCMDLKMAVYCQAVRDLEDKFHGLELHHVPRNYNKATDVIAKTASTRSRCLTGSLQVINTLLPFARRERSHTRRRNPRSWRSISHPSRTLKIPTRGFQSSSV